MTESKDEDWLIEFPQHYRTALRLLDCVRRAIDEDIIDDLVIGIGDSEADLSKLIPLAFAECTAAVLTHPEAQGNKDLVEPAASGLEVTDAMVTAAINALVYTGYNDAEQIRVIRRQATCREYVRSALQAALAAAPTSPQPIKGESDDQLARAWEESH